ncbi:MAG: hypothetical protein L3K26_06745, partial [Candidatus Hydrogenedentes bacterium]|nr:hypothetical protein [Candidatus Hydrogenedentota bacterium]
ATLFLLLLSGLGCGGSGGERREITDVEIVPIEERQLPPNITSAVRLGLEPRNADHPPHGAGEEAHDHDHAKDHGDDHVEGQAGNSETGGAGSYAWIIPNGWSEEESSPMRLANFKVLEKSECYFTVLKGQGGGLARNLNRWRSQMSLEPYSADEIAALPRKPFFGQDATYAIMDGSYAGMSGGEGQAGHRLVGLALITDESSYFVKMTGPVGALEGQLENFDLFCASLRKKEEAPAENTSEQFSAASSDNKSGLKWTAPSQWVKAPDKTSRLVTYISDGTECYATILSGQGGGLASNINRWRRQLAQAPLSSDEIKALEKLPVLGQDAPYVEIKGTFTGMEGGVQEGYMLLGVVHPIGDQTLFIKMIGPEASVTAEVEKFKSFCSSFTQ